MCVVDKIRNIPSLCYIPREIKESDILDAEISLGLEFPQEYLNYIRAFGTADFCGHELTGLGLVGKLNVVFATERERGVNKDMPRDMFVLENVGIDGIVIVMDVTGAVYLLQHAILRKVAESLSDYIEFIS